MSERLRPLWQVALAVCLGLLLTSGFVGLGVWQVKRLFWKHDLIARVEARVHAAPVALGPEASPDMEYRRVQVAGRFDHSAETHVRAVTELGGGYWVLTPLLREGAPAVLINRGFVPPERRNPQDRAAGQAEGPVTITGLARLSEPGGAFLHNNDPQAGRWYSRDVAAIGKVQDIALLPGLFIDADATPQPGGYPVGGLTVIRFRDTHLIYALTWFALAAMTIMGTALLIQYEMRLRRPGKQA